MNENENTKVVKLTDLWDVFLRCWWLMVLAAVVVSGAAKVIDDINFVPEYKSTATLYILRQNDNDYSTSGEATNDFSLALKVVNDCDYLLKSRSVVDEVIESLDIDVSYASLKSRISTSNPEDTRILEVTVRAYDPTSAKLIVDKLCEIGQEKITEAMGFEQVNLYEYGNVADAPCNKTGLTTYFMIAMIIAVLVYAVFLLIFLFDDRLMTEEDIERYLGLSILGDIPNSQDTGRRRYGYGYKYSKYAYKSRPYTNRKDS